MNRNSHSDSEASFCVIDCSSVSCCSKWSLISDIFCSIRSFALSFSCFSLQQSLQFVSGAKLVVLYRQKPRIQFLTGNFDQSNSFFAKYRPNPTLPNHSPPPNGAFQYRIWRPRLGTLLLAQLRSLRYVSNSTRVG